MSRASADFPTTGRTVVILIAVDAYENPEIKHGVPDASDGVEQLAQTLIDEYGVSSDNLYAFTNELAKSETILNTVRKLVDTLKPEDTVIIGFAGQATDRCWLPYDAESNGDGIPVFLVRGWSREFKARHVLVITDRSFPNNVLMTHPQEPNEVDAPSRELLTRQDGKDDSLADPKTSPYPTLLHHVAFLLKDSAAKEKSLDAYQLSLLLEGDGESPAYTRFSHAGDENGSYTFTPSVLKEQSTTPPKERPSKEAAPVPAPSDFETAPSPPSSRTSNPELSTLESQLHKEAVARYTEIREAVAYLSMAEQQKAWEEYLNLYESTGYQVFNVKAVLQYIQKQAKATEKMSITATPMAQPLAKPSRQRKGDSGRSQTGASPETRPDKKPATHRKSNKVLTAVGIFFVLLILGGLAAVAVIMQKDLRGEKINEGVIVGQEDGGDGTQPPARGRAQQIVEYVTLKKDDPSPTEHKSLDVTKPLSIELAAGVTMRLIPIKNKNDDHLFFMGETEVTQEQWHVIMDFNPSKFQGPNLPVENVAYEDVLTYCQRFSRMLDRKVSLPTEADWLAASLVGVESAPSAITSWHGENGSDSTHPVATKSPNGNALYDMFGNVQELTSTPNADLSGTRISLGGSYQTPRDELTHRAIAIEALPSPDTGFRIVIKDR